LAVPPDRATHLEYFRERAGCIPISQHLRTADALLFVRQGRAVKIERGTTAVVVIENPHLAWFNVTIRTCSGWVRCFVICRLLPARPLASGTSSIFGEIGREYKALFPAPANALCDLLGAARAIIHIYKTKNNRFKNNGVLGKRELCLPPDRIRNKESSVVPLADSYIDNRSAGVGVPCKYNGSIRMLLWST